MLGEPVELLHKEKESQLTLQLLNLIIFMVTLLIRSEIFSTLQTSGVLRGGSTAFTVREIVTLALCYVSLDRRSSRQK